MVLAHIGSQKTGYEIVFLLHILFAIVGFGSSFALAVGGALAPKLGGQQALGISKSLKSTSMYLTTPFTFLTGLVGFGLVGMAEGDAFTYSQTWISLAMGLWVVGVIIGFFVLKPTADTMLGIQEQLAAMGPPPEGATGGAPPPGVAQLEQLGKKMSAFSGVEHLIFAALLVLMVFKPGA